MDNKAPKAYYVPLLNVTDGEPSPGWYWAEPWSDRIRGPYISIDYADEAAKSEFSRWRLGHQSLSGDKND